MERDTPEKLLNEIKAKEIIVKSEQNRFGRELKQNFKEIDNFVKTPEFDNYFSKAEVDLKKREIELSQKKLNSSINLSENIIDEPKEELSVECDSTENKQSFFKRIINNFLNII